MLRLNRLTGAALAAMTLATGAKAADMPVYYEEPVFGGWYLRGDIGISNQVSDDLDSPIIDTLGGVTTILESEWDASWFLGFGFGYIFNDWFRADATFEYRFTSDFDGRINSDDPPGGVVEFVNDYDGEKEEAVLLLNAYWDITKWGNMTPFLGAGIGASWIKLSDFSDIDYGLGAVGLSNDVDSWNFAWALYAGLAFEINPQMTFEVGYRFLYLGDIETDDLHAPGGGLGTYNPYNFDDIHSHDVKIGLRYRFD